MFLKFKQNNLQREPFPQNTKICKQIQINYIKLRELVFELKNDLLKAIKIILIKY